MKTDKQIAKERNTNWEVTGDWGDNDGDEQYTHSSGEGTLREKMTKKIIRIMCSTECFAKIFKKSHSPTEILEGIPGDAQLFHIEKEDSNLTINFYFYSKSGKDLPEGAWLSSLPITPVIFKRIEPNKKGK